MKWTHCITRLTDSWLFDSVHTVYHYTNALKMQRENGIIFTAHGNRTEILVHSQDDQIVFSFLVL